MTPRAGVSSRPQPVACSQLHATGCSCVLEAAVQAVCQQAEQSRAERAALLDACLRLQGWSSLPLDPDGHSGCAVEGLHGRKHAAVHAQALERLPQHGPRHVVKGPFQVQEADVELPAALALALAEVLEGEQLVDD